MQTISAEEFKKRYGTVGIGQFQQPAKKPGFIERTKEAAKQGFEKIKSGGQQVNKPGANPLNLISGGLKMGAGAVEAAFSPVTAAVEPVVKPTIGRGVSYVADKLSDSPTFQRFADSKTGQVTSRVAEDVGNLNTMVGAVVGPRAGVKMTSKIGRGVTNAVEDATTGVGQTVSKVAQPVRGAIGNTIPPRSRFINEEIAKAFDLTQNDVKNIHLDTRNDVGTFVAKNNLIAGSIDDTVKLIKNFADRNYDTVRGEINKVPTKYSPTNVPRYVEALTEMLKQTADTPGLQKSTAIIKDLLKKEVVDLRDVQTVKELMDKHYSLYKATGDVKEGIAKQGLANIRKDIKNFVEREVKQNTGADIRTMNNNVQTGRSILNAIEERSTRGITRSQLSLTDWNAVLGSGLGGGLVFGPVGIATGGLVLLFKKLAQNPEIRLKIAKYLSELDTKKQLKVQETLKAGEIPEELNRFIKKPNSE